MAIIIYFCFKICKPPPLCTHTLTSGEGPGHSKVGLWSETVSQMLVWKGRTQLKIWKPRHVHSVHEALWREQAHPTCYQWRQAPSCEHWAWQPYPSPTLSSTCCSPPGYTIHRQTNQRLKTAILSWLQNDITRGFSKDQLKGKQLSPTFWPDALVIFRAKVEPWRWLEDFSHFSPEDN